MMQLVGALIFAGAFGVSVATIVAMIAPQWQRIARLAAGRPEQAFAPLRSLVLAERRIAVRRWAALPARTAMPEWRAAA